MKGINSTGAPLVHVPGWVAQWTTLIIFMQKWSPGSIYLCFQMQDFYFLEQYAIYYQ